MWACIRDYASDCVRVRVRACVSELGREGGREGGGD